MANFNWMLKGLIKQYEGVDGLKTGTTPEAGDCFTGTVERNGMRLISVVIKAKSHTHALMKQRNYTIMDLRILK